MVVESAAMTKLTHRDSCPKCGAADLMSRCAQDVADRIAETEFPGGDKVAVVVSGHPIGIVERETEGVTLMACDRETLVVASRLAQIETGGDVAGLVFENETGGGK